LFFGKAKLKIIKAVHFLGYKFSIAYFRSYPQQSGIFLVAGIGFLVYNLGM
jgi:hypothetical protein